MNPLLTIDEVAEILKVSRQTVLEYERQGIIRRTKLPSIRYDAKMLASAIEVDLDSFSPLLLKKAQKEASELKAENARLKNQLDTIKKVLDNN